MSDPYDRDVSPGFNTGPIQSDEFCNLASGRDPGKFNIQAHWKTAAVAIAIAGLLVAANLPDNDDASAPADRVETMSPEM